MEESMTFDEWFDIYSGYGPDTEDGRKAILRQSMREAWDAALANSSWKLVPVDPTEDMVIAGFECDHAIETGFKVESCKDGAELCRHVYRAMVNEAPNKP
jgi:hypothetical protein